MSLTRPEAYAVLGLPNGAPEAEIKSAYKKLALEWHPDKNNNSEAATIKFQQVTGAYQLLTAEKNEAHMSLDEMLDLFNMMFFGAGGGFPFYRPRFVFINGDRDEFYSSDDSDMEYLFNPSRGYREPNAYPRQGGREPYHRTHASSTTSTAHMGKTTYNTITVEEANKNAADLIQEEQNAKKKTEKRKSKKQRRKERKQQERVVKERHINPEDDKESVCLDNSSENEEETEVAAESKTVNKEPIIKPGPLTMDSKKGAGVDDALKGRTLTKARNKENTSPPVFSGTKDHAGAASYSETHDNKSVNIEVKSNGHAKQAKAKDAQLHREPVHSYTLPASEKIRGNGYVNGAEQASSDSEDEPEWDMGSAFFAKVASKQQPKHTKVDKKVKSKEKPVPVKEEKPTKVPANVVPQKPSPDELAQWSVQFAVQGNELASKQSYAEAIEKFTEAIKLYPQDFRYFGNRSYCFERLGKYNDALIDAELAININPIWARGYFRKARACIGLKHYREAESALCQVINLDMSEDAKQELMNVRTLRLMEMGFPQEQSEAAIWEYDTVDAALEALLRKTGALPKSGVGNMGIQNHKLPSTRPNVTVQRTQDTNGALGNSSVPPPPPYSLVSLWVGNLTSAVTEDMLQTLFRPFGQIHSFRMLLDRKCAFVNYTTKEAADRALWSLQGYQVANTNLLIRFQSASTKSVSAAAFQQPSGAPPGSKNGFTKVQSKGEKKATFTSLSS